MMCNTGNVDLTKRMDDKTIKVLARLYNDPGMRWTVLAEIDQNFKSKGYIQEESYPTLFYADQVINYPNSLGYMDNELMDAGVEIDVRDEYLNGFYIDYLGAIACSMRPIMPLKKHIKKIHKPLLDLIVKDSGRPLEEFSHFLFYTGTVTEILKILHVANVLHYSWDILAAKKNLELQAQNSTEQMSYYKFEGKISIHRGDQDHND